MRDDEGMRIIRGKGNGPKLSPVPRALIEVAPGQVVLIAVRVGAHFAGPGKGDYTDTCCRPYDLVASAELFRCGDLHIPHSKLVAVYQWEDVNECI